MAFNCQLVLVFAGDAPLGRNVFGRDAHVDGVEGVVQGAQHHVDHFGVTHARTKSIGVDRIRHTAHVFCAATNGHIGIAQQDGLAGRDDGLQARTTQTVDVECGGALRATAVDGRNAREVHVFGLSVDHVAKHHMTDVFAVGVGALQGFAHNLCRQLCGGCVFQTATKRPNGGAHTADNNNFTAHLGLLDFEKGLTPKSDEKRLQGADNTPSNIPDIADGVAAKVGSCQIIQDPLGGVGRGGQLAGGFELLEASLIREVLGRSAAQLCLHVGVNDAWGQGRDLGAMGLEGFI